MVNDDGFEDDEDGNSEADFFYKTMGMRMTLRRARRFKYKLRYKHFQRHNGPEGYQSNFLQSYHNFLHKS